MPSVSFSLRGGRLEILLIDHIMLRLVSRRAPSVSQPLLRASVLSIALSSAFAAPAFAQTTSNEKTLPSVEVTGARFPSDPAFVPIGATVITSEDIRNAGVNNVNEAIRRIGGVYGRQSSYGTSDFPLDLRGFGAAGDQNIVIVVDGIRVSENELATALLSSIAIDTVDRIEITRGGNSVLYGEGATGGVINIVTKRTANNSQRGSIEANIGSYGQRGARASIAKNWDGVSLDANYSKQRADNYRKNNQADQENFSGGLQYGSTQGRVGIRVDFARSENRFPGGLTQAEYNQDPRQTVHPNDYGSYNNDRVTLFAERRIGAFELAADFSHREKKASFFSDYGTGTTDRVMNTRVDQFSPRLRHTSENNWLKNEFVAGIDLSNWLRNDQSTDLYGGPPDVSNNYGTQKNKAFYLRNEVQINQNARIALGGRHEVVDTTYESVSVWSQSQRTEKQTLNAWDLQTSYAIVPSIRIFGKIGQSYRIANIDENAYVPSPLKPQISHDKEIGATFGQSEKTLTVRVFQQDLTNEIVFNRLAGGPGANVNLDPTRRRGLEVEGKTRLSESLTVSASWQHILATFREGTNTGKYVAAVPKDVVSARVNWLSSIHNATVGAQWVSKQRFTNDFDNACTVQMPSYLAVDARYAVRVSSWEFAVSGNNLLDKRYFSTGIACGRGFGEGIYPDSGRTLQFTARYDF